MADINFSRASAVLRDIKDSLNDLHGLSVKDSGLNSTAKADVNRDLLHAADQADLLSALIRAEYWKLRGYEDPAQALR